jgi:hypothetical protein
VTRVIDEAGTVLAEWWLLTNIADKDADAATIGRWYAWRWAIEVYQADCVSRYSLYQSRGSAHSGRCGVVGAGTMEPTASREQPRRTVMRRHSERPCPPPPRTIRRALCA